jgi:glycosyltransferase involved in cell wall biosynthesis
VSGATPEVVVAMLTYRRPDELRTGLPHLLRQAAALAPAARVLVVDNDPAGTAVDVVRGTVVDGTCATYLHEPEPGIAAGRNAALDHAIAAGARAVVFIDDDEVPEPGWLGALVGFWRDCGADAVAGPVLARHPADLDPWLRAGRFFERRRRPTGTRLAGAATNNLLLDLAALRRLGLRFDPAFGITGGSDTMLTHAMARAGADLRWCDEALVSEEVPVARRSREWVLRRAFRAGNVWGRVGLALARDESRWRRAAVRAGLLARAAKRLARGLLRSAAGVLRSDLAARATGAGDVASALGLAAGAVGTVYTEYRRPQ